MPRAQNAHAYVNAGFCFKLDEKTRVLERPNIIFGGINPDFVSKNLNKRIHLKICQKYRFFMNFCDIVPC